MTKSSTTPSPANTSLRGWGLFLIITAVLSAALPYIGVQFLILMWLDRWGSEIGWAIRGAMFLAGAWMIWAARAK
jgi:hypothetical protein